jgi:hypothetical protein
MDYAARTGTDADLAMLARRNDLTAGITDLIVERGSPEVLELLAANPRAPFSHHGLSRLAQRAQAHCALCLRLIGRDDLPEEILQSIIEALSGVPLSPRPESDGRRAAIVSGLFGCDPGEPADETPRLRSIRPLATLEALMADALLSIDEAMTELADAGDTAACAGLLARRLGLEEDVVSQALSIRCDEASALLCRAAGLRVDGYSALLRMRWRRRRDRERHNPSDALARFLNLPLRNALQVVRVLKASRAP